MLFNLAKSRLQSIHLLESLLDREKTVNRQLENDLERAKAGLQLLIEQRETNEIFCTEAVQEVLRYTGLLEESKNKIKAMETELASSKVALSTMEELVRKRNEELKAAENAMRRQAAEMDALQAKVATLEAANVELEKVNFDVLYHFVKVFLP